MRKLFITLYALIFIGLTYAIFIGNSDHLLGASRGVWSMLILFKLVETIKEKDE